MVTFPAGWPVRTKAPNLSGTGYLTPADFGQVNYHNATVTSRNGTHGNLGTEPRLGRDGRGFEGGWPGSTGQDPTLPGAGPDQTRTDMRTQNSRRGWPHSSRPSAWVSRGVRQAPGAV